jgi:hypothetical protein
MLFVPKEKTMSRIESLDAKNWEAFLASDAAVLILAKTTCANCSKWAEELEAALVDDTELTGVRFGKLYLDKPGLIAFKKANPWIADVDDLPFNAIYVKGEQVKSWAGGGFERLKNRLNRVLDTAPVGTG